MFLSHITLENPQTKDLILKKELNNKSKTGKDNVC